MRNFPYGHRRMQTGIPVCERAGIAKKFAYGDPHTHNEIVRIWGLTYTLGYVLEDQWDAIRCGIPSPRL